jgi:hypothetical protein
MVLFEFLNMAGRSFEEIERELVANGKSCLFDSTNLVNELLELANLFYHEQIPKVLALKYIFDFRKTFIANNGLDLISNFMYEHQATINASQGKEVVYSNPTQAYTIALKTYRMACAKLNIPVLLSSQSNVRKRQKKLI